MEFDQQSGKDAAEAADEIAAGDPEFNKETTFTMPFDSAVQISQLVMLTNVVERLYSDPHIESTSSVLKDKLPRMFTEEELEETRSHIGNEEEFELSLSVRHVQILWGLIKKDAITDVTRGFVDAPVIQEIDTKLHHAFKDLLDCFEEAGGEVDSSVRDDLEKITRAFLT